MGKHSCLDNVVASHEGGGKIKIFCIECNVILFTIQATLKNLYKKNLIVNDITIRE